MQLEYTDKQSEAYHLITKGEARNVLLYGGARSGKSVVLASLIIYWSLKYPGLRTLVARFRLSHAKNTIWHETVLDLMKGVPKQYWKENRQDMFIEFTNGSEIWLGGFDEKERTEKILGSEFNIIYLCEVSQLMYDTCEMAMPRLAKKIEGFRNIALFDCNPPSPLHWCHRMFIEKVDPRTLEPFKNPSLYTSFKMNPIDNIDNLTENYIETQLDTRSIRYQQRFKYGEFVKAEGTIYEEFSEENIISASSLPDMERWSVGVDFGIHMAGVLIGWSGENIYVVEDYGATNSTSSAFNQELYQKWGDRPYIAWCDPSAGERIQEITNGDKANNSVEPGIDAINDKIHNNQFFIVENCTSALSEIWDYRRDDRERVYKLNDHFMDAMRYGIFSEIAEPLQVFIG